MKNINIKNDCLDIIISTLGAEMISIVTNQTQRLHQSEPVWENCAPVLFPFCGRTRDGKYTADGREYPMKIHGFAMDREFEVVCHEADRAVFKLSSDDKTRAVYPYDFEFYVAYEINNNAIDVKYRVVNTGNKEMYFALYREVTKVIEQLQEIQQKTEEMYIQSEDRLILFEDKKEK